MSCLCRIQPAAVPPVLSCRPSACPGARRILAPARPSACPGARSTLARACSRPSALMSCLCRIQRGDAAGCCLAGLRLPGARRDSRTSGEGIHAPAGEGILAPAGRRERASARRDSRTSGVLNADRHVLSDERCRRLLSCRPSACPGARRDSRTSGGRDSRTSGGRDSRTSGEGILAPADHCGSAESCPPPHCSHRAVAHGCVLSATC